MIVGKIDELPLFFALHPAIEYAHKFLVEYKECPIPEGTHELYPGRITANISSYNTVEDADTRHFEAHEKNCDIQVMLRGKELVGWSPLCNCSEQISEEYSKGGDIAFYADPKNISSIVLDEDTFVLFRPEDAHKPCIAVDGCSEKVTKVVFKFVID